MHLDPMHLIGTYGYAAVGGIVGLESLGVPLPGETTLIAAATFAGATHHLDIGLVIAAAAAGAVAGDSAGFWIGRGLGWPLLHRYGPHIGLTEPRLKLGQYLFLRHGGKVVFFARFIAALRAFAALLAGANRMNWSRFLAFNMLGGVAWAALMGFAAYLFGHRIHAFAAPVGIGLLAAAVLVAIAGLIFVRRHEQALIAEAERALPGPVRHRPPEDRV
jgi:membrane protein DedA with SNARE-associated domain